MSGQESGKKHLLIEVPDHASQSGDENRRMKTFLRMGTFDADAPGMSLIEDAMSEGFVDDDRDRGDNPKGYPKGSPGHVLTKAERVAETARLRTRGGWQDHSDGNRLSTTMGDKVEVVRGNSLFLVLGRQDDDLYAAGWDLSGGKIEDADIYPPTYTEWKWVQTWDGTWKLTQMSEKTDVHEITHGNLKEEFYGDRIESIIGSEDQPDIDIPDVNRSLPENKIRAKKKRPDIVEKTWAKSITSDTGSATVPIPTITETTFAGAITSATNATAITEATTSGTINSTTTAVTSISDTTTAPTIEEVTNVGVTATSKTLGLSATINDYTGQLGAPVLQSNQYTYAGVASEFAVIGVNSSNQALGLNHSFQTIGAQDDVALIGANLAVVIAGAMLDVELSAIRGEVKAGLGFVELEAAIIYVEIFIGIKMEISLGQKVTWDSTKKELVLEKNTGIGL